MTMTFDRDLHRATTHLHGLLTRDGTSRLIIGDTPHGLWYSNGYFGKPADEALRRLLAQRDLELVPAVYTIDMPDDEDEFAPDEEEWEPGPPINYAAVMPDPAAPTVVLEPLRLSGCPALIRHLRSGRLAYVFRRTDDRLVLLNPDYVHLLAGADNTGWRCRQSEPDANGLVCFDDAAGRLGGILMPIMPPDTNVWEHLRGSLGAPADSTPADDEGGQ